MDRRRPTFRSWARPAVTVWSCPTSGRRSMRSSGRVSRLNSTEPIFSWRAVATTLDSIGAPIPAIRCLVTPGALPSTSTPAPIRTGESDPATRNRRDLPEMGILLGRRLDGPRRHALRVVQPSVGRTPPAVPMLTAVLDSLLTTGTAGRPGDLLCLACSCPAGGPVNDSPRRRIRH